MKKLLLLVGLISQIAFGATQRRLEADYAEGVVSYKNPIKNGQFEKNAAGWTTFNDASTFTDGTGGSPTATIARTTSTPLEDAASGLFTPGGAGDGACYTVSIPRSWQNNKVLELSFDYEIGTYTSFTDGDVQVWIAPTDGTNTNAIQPTPYKLEKISGQAQFKTSFQTTLDGTSFRVCLYQNTATTSWGTLKLDNLTLSSVRTARGPPVNDWISFTPTGTWIANSTYAGRWRRVGDSMQIEATVSVAGGAPTSADLYFNMPTGYTIDTTKLTSTTAGKIALGSAVIVDSGTKNYVGAISLVSSTQVLVSTADSAGDGIVRQNNPITFGTGDSVAINATLPIAGWSSAVQMSSDAETRIVAFKAHSSVTVVAAASVETTVINPTESFDTHNAYDTTTGIFTAPVTGIYRFSAGVQGAGLTYAATNNLILSLAKNGTSATNGLDVVVTEASVSQRMYLFGTTTLSLNAGDTVRVRCAQNNASSSTLAGGEQFNFFEGERLSGPSAIAASESVSARFTSTAGAALTNSATILDMPTKDYDSHGAVTTGAAWKFTAPMAGKYSVKFYGETASFTGVLANGIWADLYKNGVFYSRIGSDVCDAATTTTKRFTGSDTISLLAGDYIDVRVAKDSGITVSLSSAAGRVRVAIERVGN